MLTALILLGYIAVIFYIYGAGAVFLLQKKISKNIREDPVLILLIGLVLVTTLASFASLVMRINWEFQLILLAGALLIYFYIVRKNFSAPKIPFKEFNLAQKLGFCFLILCLTVSFYQAIQVPTNSDTGIYHAQTIHWIESYPAIPGLGNFHHRLTFNSSWLLLNAVFSFSFLGIESFHLLSGFLFLLMQIYFYQGIHHLLGKTFTLSNFLRLAFFLSISFFLTDQISSPGTDAPTTLFVWFVLTATLVLLEKKSFFNQSLECLSLFMLSFFCITLKLSAAPILLLPLIWWIVLLIKRNFRQAGLGVLIAFIILLPFVGRNIIQTGYPVYPGFPYDLFHFDWAIPLGNVWDQNLEIHWFAMLSSVPIESFLKMSLVDQTNNWFANQLPRHKAILLSIPAGLCFNLVLCLFKAWRKFIKENLGYLIVYSVGLAGCAFWFFSAPAMRFGYGFLLGASFMTIFPAAVFILNRVIKIQEFGKWAVLCGCIGLLALNLRTTLKIDPTASTLLLPADYPQWSSEPCQFKNFTVLCQAGYDSCWYSPFPCALRGNDHVEMRGNDYRDGFRVVP